MSPWPGTTTTLPFYHLPPPSFYYKTNSFHHLHTLATTPRWWWQTGESSHICTSSSRVLLFYYNIAKEEQGSRHKYVSSPKYVFFFFLLSFFILLINNLCLEYFYGNHDNEWPLAPLSRCKWRIGQERGQQRLEPTVSFFFFFFSFFFFKFLLLFFLLNVYFQEIYHNGNEQPLPSLSTKQMRTSNIHHCHHTNDGWKTGQSNRRDNRGLSPSVCFFSFFTYFLSSKYLIASRTAAL